jgi:hypothetical protein
VIEFCHTGIRSGSSDQKIINNTILACRDYRLHIVNGHTHNVSAYNHYYGFANTENDGTAVFNRTTSSAPSAIRSPTRTTATSGPRTPTSARSMPCTASGSTVERC